MSEEGKVRKHRHDGPDVSHGAHTQERTAKVIQFVLGCCIVLTVALVVYTLLTANAEAAPIID